MTPAYEHLLSRYKYYLAVLIVTVATEDSQVSGDFLATSEQRPS